MFRQKLNILLGSLFALMFLFVATERVAAAIPGDVNGDNRVDILDIGITLDNYNRTVCGLSADLNGDCRVNIIDIGIIIDHYGDSATATPTPAPPPPGAGVWISHNELMSRPTSGAAWNSILSAASSSWGSAAVSNQDSNHDQKVLAGAYACARTGQYCDKTIQGLKAAIGTENGARWLAVGRNLLGYTIAADVMRNSGRLTGSDLSTVSNWLAQFLTRTLASNNSSEQEILTPFESGSNASAQEGAVYAAIARYTGNSTKLNYVWNRFRLYSCDRAGNPEQTINIRNGFDGGWSHTTDYNQACAINPKGSAKSGHSIDGAAINDIVRGGSFTWPPGVTQYVWTGFRGYIDAAVVLQRAGFPAVSLKDSAVLRNIQYICYLENNTTGSWWNSSGAEAAKHLARSIYGFNTAGCGINYPVGDDMILGFTDWTHP